MVRKTHKGIMGKTKITDKNRPHIGPGIGFKEMNLGTGDQIEQAAKSQDKKLD